MSGFVAWRVYILGWGHQPVAVTIASTRAKAIRRNHASARETGYAFNWTDFRAIRSPEHDSWFERHGLFSWSWEHVQLMQQSAPDSPAARREG